MKKAIITIFLFLIPLAVLASGELEVDYPSIPKTEDIENIEAGLPYYIKYIFNFSLWIVGILAFVLLIKTGFEYLTSAGNPSKLKETKDQMLAILLGIAILFGSTFILKTIDPSFTNLDIGEIETVETLPPPSPTQSISPDPLVRIRNLAKTTKDSIAPTLKDENKKLNPLVVKCNCIYTSSKCDCKSWTCTPVYGNGGGCPCKKFLESVLPGTPANIIGQALEGLNSSTVGQILSMVPGISSDDLTPSGFLGLPKEIQEKVKEALSNVENFKEVALSILGVEGSLDSLSGEDIYNFASNLFNLPEIDIEELFSETSGEKIKEFFSSLAQIPNPEDLISSFSEGNLEKIANSFINMSSGEIEETFSNFSPETIKEIATNLSGIDINNISNSLNENTIKELANKFLSLPKENIKNDISNLSKNDLINIISNISESNLEEAASILPDIDKEDLISNLSSLSEENLEEALSEILSLNGQSVLEDLPFKEIQKIASNISNGNIEDIIPLLPTSKIEEIAKEFINFSPETIKDYLPIDVLKKVAEGIFKLPSEILDKALSDLSKEDFLGMIKDFSKIDPGKIQEIISNLSEGDLKEILSSLSKEKLKEILEEGKIPFADLKEVSSNCYGDPCFNRDKIMEEQIKIVLAADELLYYRNRINSEREDLETEIYYHIQTGKLTKNQTESLEKYLKDVLVPMEEMAEISKELSLLPDKCLAPEKCQAKCGGGCHDGCKGIKGCYPKTPSGGNPCPIGEIEKKVKETEEKLKEIRKICDKIMAILN